MMREGLSPNPGFDVIVAYDVSRFGRGDIDETCRDIHLLSLNGVEVEFAAENITNDDNGILIRLMKQWIARQKSIHLSKVTIRGQVSRARKGGWNGGKPPYGYDLRYFDPTGTPYMTVRFVPNGDEGWKKEIYDKDGHLDRVLADGNRIPVPKGDDRGLVLGQPTKVEVVRRIFQMYTRDDLGLRRICETLNSERIPASRGGKWSTLAVRGIVTNPLYTGTMVWNRTSFGHIHRVSQGGEKRLPKGDTRKRRYNPRREWIDKDDSHEAIVDLATFELAHRKLKERGLKHVGVGFRSGRAKRSPYLLTGLIHCTRCGHNFQGYTCSRKGRGDTTKRVKTMYYVCNGYVNSGNSVCPRSAFKKEGLEEQVLALVGKQVDVLLHNGGAKKLRAGLAQSLRTDRPDVTGETKAIRKELRAVENDRKRLVASLTPKNKAILDEEFVELAERREGLESRLREFKAMEHMEVDIDATVDEIMASVRGFEDLFPHGTLEEQKEFIRLWVDRIELDPDRRAGKAYMKRFPVAKNGAKESLLVCVSKARFEPATFRL
jgi:hypothetical protein